MPYLFCQDRPDVYEMEARVVDIADGAVRVDASPFFPGGGGQLADRGRIAWTGGEAAITGIRPDGDGAWLDLAEGGRPQGDVRLRVDRDFRNLMRELHTLAHVVNSLVYTAFDGALLTGAQLGADATFRLDFDLPDADNDRLRALDGPTNEVIKRDLRVRAFSMAWADAEAQPGMFRSKAVAPPPGDDGSVRIVEIGDLDRQACGGTHLLTTGEARRVRILKVENKGRHNRRVRVGLVDDE